MNFAMLDVFMFTIFSALAKYTLLCKYNSPTHSQLARIIVTINNANTKEIIMIEPEVEATWMSTVAHPLYKVGGYTDHVSMFNISGEI